MQKAKTANQGKREEEVPPPPQRHQGSALWSTKLDENEIRRIRKMFENGWQISQLAREYKTTWLTMSRIVKGQSWKHVKE